MASLGQLTARIAHEIKNPLNFVNNFADLSVELLDELKETTAPAINALGDEKRGEIGETITMLTGNLEKIAERIAGRVALVHNPAFGTDAAPMASSRACWSIHAAAAANVAVSISTA